MPVHQYRWVVGNWLAQIAHTANADDGNVVGAVGGTA
jgi:hypothetical protein